VRSKFGKTGFIRKISSALLGRSGDSQTLPPPPGPRMTRVRVFVTDLAKAGNSFAEIKEKVYAAYRGRSLSLSQIYRIIKLASAGKDTEDQGAISTPKKQFARRISSPPWPPP
jgi:hypothetical protein